MFTNRTTKKHLLALTLAAALLGLCRTLNEVQCIYDGHGRFKINFSGSWMHVPPSYEQKMVFPTNPQKGIIYTLNYQWRIGEWVYQGQSRPAPQKEKINYKEIINKGRKRWVYRPRGCRSSLRTAGRIPKGDVCSSSAELFEALNAFRANPILAAVYIKQYECTKHDYFFTTRAELDETINFIINLHNDHSRKLDLIGFAPNYQKAISDCVGLCVHYGTINHIMTDSRGYNRGPWDRIMDYSKTRGSLISEDLAYSSNGESCYGYIVQWLVDTGVPDKGHRKSITQHHYDQGAAGLSPDGTYAGLLLGSGYF